MNTDYQPASSGEPQVHSPKFASLLQQAIEFFAECLFRKSDPVTWQEFDRNGNTFWMVYDPNTQHSIRFDSEIDVRVWLEKRFSC